MHEALALLSQIPGPLWLVLGFFALPLFAGRLGP